MKSFLIIGLGRFGSSVASELFRLGHEVLAVDKDETLVNDVAQSVTNAVICDARDETALKALGVKNFDCVVVGIGTDLAASAIITVNLKELGAKQVICKATSGVHQLLLEKVGADKVVFPEYEIAQKLAQGLSSASILDYIELSKDFGLAEVKAPSSWVGKSIGAIGIRAKYGVNIIAARENGGIAVSPSADFIILKSTSLMVVGNYKDIEAIQRL